VRYRPTKRDRRRVSKMAGCGMTVEEIGTVLELSHQTVSKHFKYELAASALTKNASVAGALYKQATRYGHVGAMTFWLKCRARWKPEANDFEEGLSAQQQARAIRDALATLNDLEDAEV